MLHYLSIQNFALIDHLELDFKPGMTVFTGETGAGKSILVDALLLVLGGRMDSSVIRLPNKSCFIIAHFNIKASATVQAWLQEHHLDNQQQCLIQRTLNHPGRSQSFINGHSVSLQMLRTLGGLLVHIHSQQAQQALLKTDQQRLLLDQYGGYLNIKQQVHTLYEQWHQVKKQLLSLKTQDKQPHPLLSYQLEELIQLALQAEELDQLDQEQRQLANVQQLLQTGYEVLDLIGQAEPLNILALLSTVKQKLAFLGQFDQHLSATGTCINNAIIQIEEAQFDLRQYLSHVEPNPERLVTIEHRLEQIYEIARKHRVKPEQLLECQQRLSNELELSRQNDSQHQALQQQQSKTLSDYQKTADYLSKQRQRVAQGLQALITKEMHRLNLPGSQFEIRLRKQSDDNITRFGHDQIEFHVSTNPGQTLQPLSKIASGGELARISLAIHALTAQKMETPTLIFDEIDIGMGGHTAETVGRLLHQLGQSRQVFCVTHSPQVASQAQQHLQISKITIDRHTKTQVRFLKAEEKIDEIARMLAGPRITSQTLAHAKAMLSKPHHFIRSFARRQGRISQSQAKAYTQLLSKYGVSLEDKRLNLDQLFQQPAPIVLEIGFGMGHTLLQQAVQQPNYNYLGIEVYRPGVGAILRQIAQLKLTNLRIFCADAVEVLDRCILPSSLSQVQIFFPDPWPKTRHHKRRLIQPPFIDLLREKLISGGRLYFTTDIQDYALQALNVLEKAIGWKNVIGYYKFAPRPIERPVSKFEERAKRLGHLVWELIFTCVP